MLSLNEEAVFLGTTIHILLKHNMQCFTVDFSNVNPQKYEEAVLYIKTNEEAVFMGTTIDVFLEQNMQVSSLNLIAYRLNLRLEYDQSERPWLLHPNCRMVMDQKRSQVVRDLEKKLYRLRVPVQWFGHHWLGLES